MNQEGDLSGWSELCKSVRTQYNIMILGDMPTPFLCSVVFHLYWPTASFYLYDLRHIFRGLKKVSHDCITMMMSDTSEPPNSSHQVSTMSCVVMLWSDPISWFKWWPCIPTNGIMKVKPLQHASCAHDKNCLQKRSRHVTQMWPHTLDVTWSTLWACITWGNMMNIPTLFHCLFAAPFLLLVSLFNTCSTFLNALYTLQSSITM